MRSMAKQLLVHISRPRAFAAIACMAFSLIPAMHAQPPPATQPLPTPSTTGPLQTAAPATINAGPLGTLEVTGLVSGLALAQQNHLPGDKSPHLDLSNGQVFLQKTEGWWQFYVQAGAYTIPALGVAYYATVDTVRDFYGPLPVSYLKLAPSKNVSVLAGLLPTLFGAESTFTFQNMNIEPGLLWNQENAVNRGVQVNGSLGKWSASLSWNDGFYSDRFTWLSGSLSYAFNGANTLAFVAGANLGQTAFRSLPTPVQNNSSIYDVIYTYSAGRWMLQPYFQYTDVPTNAKAGIAKGAATSGGAVLATYKFRDHFWLGGRGEYISATGSAAGGAVNLLYGPGSAAWSLTVTPTYQNHGFFLRGDISVVSALRYTPGAAFGPAGSSSTQPRAAVEAGVMF